MKVILLFSTLFLFGFGSCKNTQWKMAISSPQNGATVNTPAVNMKGTLYLSGSYKEDNRILAGLSKEQIEKLKGGTPALDGNIFCNGKKAIIDRNRRTWALDGVPLPRVGANTIACYYQDPRGNTSQVSVVVSYKPVTQNIPPIANFSATPTFGTAPLNVHFDASASSDSDGTIVSYEWKLGNGTTKAGKIIDYTYTASGKFLVELKVIDDKGASHTKTTTIVVNAPPQPPVAEFSITPLSGPAPLNIVVDASASYYPGHESEPDHGISNCTWTIIRPNSGDKKTIKNQSCVNNFVITEVGISQITLKVFTTDGKTSSKTKTVEVFPNEPEIPIADFIFSPSSGPAPLNITVDGTASYLPGHEGDSDHGITSCQWIVSGPSGDKRLVKGHRDNNCLAQLTINDVGVNNITLIVQAINGQTATRTKNVTVSPNNQVPIANFTITPPSGQAPLNVLVDATSSYLPGYENSGDRGIASCSWVITPPQTGDKKKSRKIQDPNCSKNFTINDIGISNITLTVQAINGMTASLIKQVTVTGGSDLFANFTFNESPVGSGTVYFDASSSQGNIVSYEWDFDDQGQTANGVSVNHSFNDYRIYNVKLSVSDSEGHSSTITKQVDLRNQNPVADFSVQDLGNGTFRFNGSLSHDVDGTIISYLWEFGDQTTGMGISTIHTYGQAGNYPITLTITDNAGATGTIMKFVLVIGSGNQNPVPAFNFTQMTVGSPYQFDFNASDSIDNDGQITNYFWSFDDGQVASGVQVSHSFQNAGNHSATLTITDDQGGQASLTKQFFIELVNGTFVNSNFTNASLLGWVTAGNIELTKRCTFFADNYVERRDCDPLSIAALVSNSDDNEILGELKQTFIVPSNATKITGKIRFLTNELAPFRKSFDDLFAINFKDSTSDTNILQGTVANTPLLSGVGGYQFASTIIPFEIQLTSLRGTKVTLGFKVLDEGDSMVDSALTITDLTLVEE